MSFKWPRWPTVISDVRPLLDLIYFRQIVASYVGIFPFHQFLLLRQMQKSVNNAVPSNNNNMLVPDDEIVVERIPYNQEDLLMKENQVLKVGH